jgi:hypothetical protein
MNIKRVIFIFTLLLSTHLLNSQNEFSKWYFGGGIPGLDFSTSPPTVLSNGNGGIGTTGGCATICDNTGNLLFYSNGVSIANSAHVAMANGTGLNANNGSTQTVMIVKQPGNTNLYYVFTTVATGWLSYSIVDMNLAAGLGSVTVKNATVDLPTCNRIVAVRHCNGKDAWIISHDANSNKFKTFLLDQNGVSSTPVVSMIGPSSTTISGGGGSVVGFLKISPDGRKLALTQYSNSIPASSGPQGFYLFDFDPGTGVVSNSLQLNQATAATGIEFSLDGKRLYGAMDGSALSTSITLLYQWDLCAGSNAAIIASQYTLVLGTNNSYRSGALQRGIDGKIYLTAVPSGTAANYYISVINNPNNTGAAMNFVMNGQLVSTSLTLKPSGGLPNYINTYTKPLMPAVSKTIACQTVNFAVPTPTFAGGCIANTYPINSYLWDFGDPATGSANNSTVTNPSHLFSALGTYTVKTILYSNCTNDTLVSTVNITTLSPVVSILGNTLVCKGDKRIYTATGANSYVWSTSATTASVSLSPSVTTVYTVTGTTNGCKTSKEYTLTVEPCTGISMIDKTSGINLFPNPFTNELSIEVAVATEIVIIDIAGRIVLNTNIQKGLSTINTSDLKPGLYFVQCSTDGSVSRFRIVKSE